MKRNTWLLLVIGLFVFASGCCNLKKDFSGADQWVRNNVWNNVKESDQWIKDNLW